MKKSLLLVGAAWLGMSFASLTAAEIDESPLAIEAEVVYPNLKFRRPIALTHAGDGSGRTFVVSQYGAIHILSKDRNADSTTVFLDIEPKVLYKDAENEQGLLGLAFHPKYRTNGEFFLYYCPKDSPLTIVISRFRTSSSDPNKADPASEEELLRVTRPFWNHAGGSIVFGPDGYLYAGLGDGGSANDPQGNGQKLSTLLGKILRIDVDHKDGFKKYAIPKDNPFVGKADARPEIWAFGLRNVWRMNFDGPTGIFWAADVGQDLWEEVDHIVKGGNYGWSLREGNHKFKNGSDERPDLIDPVWEYPHSVGRSITGGHVYRGKKVPTLAGHYLYADYVTGWLWGLKYDEGSKKVVANRKIAGPNLPVMSFGEDHEGEAYFMTDHGRLYSFRPTAAAK